jgi:hypothetical protein
MPYETSVTVSTKNNQARLKLVSGVNNPLPRGRSFHGQTLCPKTCVPSERRAEFGYLFCGLADLIRCIGVEVAHIDRLEADIGGLPYAKHDRVAASRELTSRALDG